MFNLLPDNQKEKIRSEYHVRLVIIALIFVIFLQVSFLIFLFPSWIISCAKEKEIISQSKASNKSSQDMQIDSIDSTINLINAKLSAVNTTLDYPKMTLLIDGVISQKSKDIHIQQITYTPSSANTGNINLAGVSATRESLVLFVKNLEESKLFNNVDLPVSNFTKNRDIDFSISMAITP